MKFLDLWNRFVHRNSVIHDYEMPNICLSFVRCFAATSMRQLREQLLLHLMMLWEKQQISSVHLDNCLKEYDSLVPAHGNFEDVKASNCGTVRPPSRSSTPSVLSEMENGDGGNSKSKSTCLNPVAARDSAEMTSGGSTTVPTAAVATGATIADIQMHLKEFDKRLSEEKTEEKTDPDPNSNEKGKPKEGSPECSSSKLDNSTAVSAGNQKQWQNLLFDYEDAFS